MQLFLERERETVDFAPFTKLVSLLRGCAWIIYIQTQSRLLIYSLWELCKWLALIQKLWCLLQRSRNTLEMEKELCGFFFFFFLIYCPACWVFITWGSGETLLQQYGIYSSCFFPDGGNVCAAGRHWSVWRCLGTALSCRVGAVRVTLSPFCLWNPVIVVSSEIAALRHTEETLMHFIEAAHSGTQTALCYGAT